MTPALFPEMAHSTFQPLLDRLEENGQARAHTSAEIRELLAACGFGAAVLEKGWESLQHLLCQGMESRKMHLIVKEFLDILELAIKTVYPKVRAITVGKSLADDERLAGLATLDQLSLRAAKMRDELASLQRLLETPPPRVKIESFSARDKAGAADHRGYVDVEEILAKLKAGQDI
jgi:hypothetical protein